MAAKNTAKTAPAASDELHACECSRYDAVFPDELTDANLESGDYQIFETGCTATTRRLFAPGHDAKLKSALIKWGALGLDIRRTDEGGVATSAEATKHASAFKFAHMVAAGIKRAEDKRLAKLAKAEERAAKKVAKAEPANPIVTAKVGRWERQGTVTDGVFTYTDAKGATKTATKFALVG
ncbi:hypothetical protein ACFV6U_09240 [Streptomyces sp. NPDC059810]|uniref:hypothetical protein n=1 Tax=Streptomyces sp. NPDC059810 TaxID=3346956 RepID=UPI003652D5F2